MIALMLGREHLQGIPEKLEAKLSEKRFLTAVELLQDGLTQIRKPNMDEIGALSDLKVYLSNQEQVRLASPSRSRLIV
jgi:exocyst complex component 4